MLMLVIVLLEMLHRCEVILLLELRCLGWIDKAKDFRDVDELGPDDIDKSFLILFCQDVLVLRFFVLRPRLLALRFVQLPSFPLAVDRAVVCLLAS